MSQDKKSYGCVGLHHGGRVRAAAYCLRGLFDRAVSDEDRLNQIAWLAATWQKRVSRLQRAGWSFLQDIDVGEARRILWRMQRCRPFGVTTSPRLPHTCHKPHICPWCWCREIVQPTYNRMRDLLFASPRSRKRSTKHNLPLCELLVITSKVAVNRDEKCLPDVYKNMLAIKEFFGRIFRRDFARHKKAAAAICSTVEPTFRRADGTYGTDCWAARQLIIWLRPADILLAGRPPEEKFGLFDNRCQVRRFLLEGEAYSRNTLVKAVGHFATYPHFMLSGHPECLAPILELLEDRQKHIRRMYEPYGLMRNKCKEVVEIKQALEEDAELEQEDFLHV